MGLERRRTPRYQFIAQTEIVEIESGAKFKAQTGDLSIGGCFLDMLAPLPQDSLIQLTISHAKGKFTALGRIVFVFPQLGMGVIFTDIEPAQHAVLEQWVAELDRSCRLAAFALGAGLGMNRPA
jgi:hypothetical protein